MAFVDTMAPIPAAAAAEERIEVIEGSGPDLYRFGLKFSSGPSAQIDLVKAHMCFNLAALKGVEEAKQCRKELAEQMTSDQIASAQRLAREWLARPRGLVVSGGLRH